MKPHRSGPPSWVGARRDPAASPSPAFTLPCLRGWPWTEPSELRGALFIDCASAVTRWLQLLPTPRAQEGAEPRVLSPGNWGSRNGPCRNHAPVGMTERQAC